MANLWFALLVKNIEDTSAMGHLPGPGNLPGLGHLPGPGHLPDLEVGVNAHFPNNWVSAQTTSFGMKYCTNEGIKELKESY